MARRIQPHGVELDDFDVAAEVEVVVGCSSVVVVAWGWVVVVAGAVVVVEVDTVVGGAVVVVVVVEVVVVAVVVVVVFCAQAHPANTPNAIGIDASVTAAVTAGR